jgi:RIO kinase 1
MRFEDLDFEEVSLGEEKLKIEKQTRKLIQKVLDQQTLKHLEKLSKDLQLENIYGSIAEGKESVVFLAKATNGDYLAIKVYRIDTFPIKKLRAYIAGDPRFDVPASRTKFVFVWVRKEFANLRRAFEHGVFVPRPVKHIKNVLAMELIGEDGIPDPKLLEAELEDPKETLELIIQNYINLYNGAKLVHADLSEYNILIHQRKLPFFIDMSQAVLRGHPMASEWLHRDIENVLNFFSSKYGINLDLEETLRRITGEENVR